MADSKSIVWPEGKAFAFTIVDDTDQSRLPRIKAVYDFLAENQFRTTKTVWPLRALGQPITGGESLEDAEYREWVRSLQRAGFEIAIHGVSDETSTRDRAVQGLDRIREFLEADPEMHVNHVGQREGMYWGSARFDTPIRQLYELYLRVRRQDPSYFGHVQGSPYFWGDLCRERIRFVRGMVWPDITTLRADPLMPYHDPRRPFVSYWYSASHGSSEEGFCRLLSEANQDRLAEEGGACIVYTHLGSSTFHQLSAKFRSLVVRLARMRGWFVPASTLLNYIGEQRGWIDTGQHEFVYRRMQWRWLTQQFKHRL